MTKEEFTKMKQELEAYVWLAHYQSSVIIDLKLNIDRIWFVQ